MAVSLVAALVAVSPFFFLGTASGHDIAFHMASWLDAAGQWKQGILLPRWAEWPNYGFGEPRFIFYPPLSWLVGALLGSLLPWQSVTAVFIVSVQTFAGVSSFAFLRRLSTSESAQLFGAACFAANPYALLIIYARSDFAELLAIAFLPLLFLAASRLAAGWQRDRLVAFAFVFSAVWLSNAPAAVIATYAATLACLLAAVETRTLAPLLGGACGLALGFGLAGFYLVPAIYEQRWVNISGALASGLAPAENFLYARTADPEHDAFNHVASNIALLLLLWAVVAAFLAWRRRSTLSSHRGVTFALTTFSSLPIVVALLMLPLTGLVWRYLPELRFVQFPWRWMSVAAVCAMVLTAFSFSGKLRWVWLAAVVVAFTSSGRYLVKHSWWDSEDMPTLEAALADQSGFEGTDEYDPQGDDHSDLPEKQPSARFLATSEASTGPYRQIFVDEWTAERRRLRVVTPAPARVALRLLDYPAWIIRVNGQEVLAQHQGGTRQIAVEVAAGESKIEVQFGRTLDRTLGGWLSAISLMVSAGLLLWPKKPLPAAGG